VISRTVSPLMIASLFCTSAGSPAEDSSMTTWEMHSQTRSADSPTIPASPVGARDKQVTTWTSDQVADERRFQVHRFHADPSRGQRAFAADWRWCSRSND